MPRRTVEKSTSLSAANLRMSFQIVGTPPTTVAFSSRMKRVVCSGCRNRSGKSRSAPTIQQAYGIPHAFA